MTLPLRNTLQDIERMVKGIREGKTCFTLHDAFQLFQRVNPEKIRETWEQTLYAALDEACLSRYFTAQLKTLINLFEIIPRHEELTELITELLSDYRQYIDPEIVFPGTFYTHRIIVVGNLPGRLNNTLKNAKISSQLQACLMSYLRQFEPDKENCRFSLRSMEYFERLAGKIILLDLQHHDAENQIHEVLLELNFNHLHYLAYRQNRILESLSRKESADILMTLGREWYALKILPEQNRYVYHPDWPSLITMLTGFLQVELDMRRQQGLAESTCSKEAVSGKIPLELSVAQLACLIWLCYETGILGTKNLTEIFKAFTQTFSSKKQQQISPGGLSKAYYSISQVTAAVMRDKLAKMIVRINHNFFPA